MSASLTGRINIPRSMTTELPDFTDTHNFYESTRGDKMNDKTHYRKAFNSPYLSSADIVEATVLTIKHVKLESDMTRKTKDFFNTAYFVENEIRPGEPLKPMILNACNSKSMKTLAESPFIDDWNNIRVSIYVDQNVRFGRDTVEGLRINPNPPKPAQKPASAEQLATIQEYKDEGVVDKATLKWLESHTLTVVTAKRLITKLESAKNVD